MFDLEFLLLFLFVVLLFTTASRAARAGVWEGEIEADPGLAGRSND